MTENALKALADHDPYRHDVMVGLVAPLGSSRSEVVSSFTRILEHYEYTVQHIRLADLLNNMGLVGDATLPDRSQPDYYEKRMNAGDRLREAAGDGSALAALAIARVAKDREDKAVSSEANRPTVFIFDSLKHPREADLLRAVYGDGFWLVAIVQDLAERRRNLIMELSRQEARDSVPEARAVELLARDESDAQSKHGQHVREVFSTADYFLPIRSGEEWNSELSRLLEGMFGAPFLTPRGDEEAMRVAHAAALRSAAVGRQVGAVIVPPAGTPLITGTNEVPKPGGGQFWEGDQPDLRDFRTGTDPNPDYVERMLREVFDRLAQAGYFTNDRNARGGADILREALTADASGRSVLDGARAKSLIEFTRCLHAEQAAIVNAARSGVSTLGASLFTTTFPCHECTKFIIGCGIRSVQYIEPYPKSLASFLYEGLIDSFPPLEGQAEGQVLKSVPFRSYVGYGPSRYDDVFRAGERRVGGMLAEHVTRTARPIGDWNEIGVRSREDEVVLAAKQAVARASAHREMDFAGDGSQPEETGSVSG